MSAPRLPAEADTTQRVLKLPLLGSISWPMRLLGMAAGGALILAIATVQPRLYPDLPIAVLYIVPIVLVAWVAGAWPGVLAAVAAATARLFADNAAGIAPSDPSVPYWNFGISITLYMITAWLLALLHRTLLYERSLARTDPLTTLGNRRFFEHVAAVELHRSRRYGRSFALAYVDVDHFKEVNDRLGHATGDRLLARAAEVLVRVLRTSDVVARLGGDEFAVLLPETPGEGAAIAMEKAHERLTAEMAASGFDVTFSIGVVTYQSGPATLAELLDAADRVMYSVKRDGRAQIRCAELGGALTAGATQG